MLYLTHGEIVALDEKLVTRLGELVTLTGGKHMEEVVEVLESLDEN